MNFWQKDRDLEEELASHLKMAAQERIERGESPADAESNARREFGNVGLVYEVTRETEGWAWFSRFLQDLRYGARLLRRNPTFALVSVFTLALGVGASTAIFSVVYGVLLRPLPYEKPDQIVRVWERDDKGNRLSFSDANFTDVRTQSRSFQGLAEYHSGIGAVSGGAEPQRVPIAYVSHDFFDVFAIQPVLGRRFLPEEYQLIGPPAAIVSYGFWQSYLDGEEELSSARLNVENQAVTVVGVLQPGFRYPDDTQLWLSSDTSEK